jgi:nitrogen regulatory protein PII
MKCLTLVVHEAAQAELLDALQQMPEIDTFVIQRCEGHSNKEQANPFETARDLVVGYVPRIRIDLVVPDAAIENILFRLSGCDSCIKGLGIYWVSTVELTGKL